VPSFFPLGNTSLSLAASTAKSSSPPFTSVSESTIIPSSKVLALLVKKYPSGLNKSLYFLPIPQIYLIPLELDNIKTTQALTIEWGKKTPYRPIICCGMKERWNYMRNKALYPNMKLIVTCTELEKYNYLCEQFEYYKKLYFKTGTEFIKDKWLRIGSERKVFLGERKSIFVSILIEKLKKKKKRFICFCASIFQADLLGEQNAIHSKKKFN